MRTERIEQIPKAKETGALLLKEESSAQNQKKNEAETSPQLDLRKGSSNRKKFNREEKFKLDIYELFTESFSQEKPLMLKDFIDNLERSIIINVLDRVHGHQREAAKVLGIKFTTLNEKIKKYKICFKKSPVIQRS